VGFRVRQGCLLLEAFVDDRVTVLEIFQLLQLGRIVCRENVLTGNLPLLRVSFVDRNVVGRESGFELVRRLTVIGGDD